MQGLLGVLLLSSGLLCVLPRTDAKEVDIYFAEEKQTPSCHLDENDEDVENDDLSEFKFMSPLEEEIFVKTIRIGNVDDQQQHQQKHRSCRSHQQSSRYRRYEDEEEDSFPSRYSRMRADAADDETDEDQIEKEIYVKIIRNDERQPQRSCQQPRTKVIRYNKKVDGEALEATEEKCKMATRLPARHVLVKSVRQSPVQEKARQVTEAEEAFEVYEHVRRARDADQSPRDKQKFSSKQYSDKKSKSSQKDLSKSQKSSKSQKYKSSKRL